MNGPRFPFFLYPLYDGRSNEVSVRECSRYGTSRLASSYTASSLGLGDYSPCARFRYLRRLSLRFSSALRIRAHNMSTSIGDPFASGSQDPFILRRHACLRVSGPISPIPPARDLGLSGVQGITTSRMTSPGLARFVSFKYSHCGGWAHELAIWGFICVKKLLIILNTPRKGEQCLLRTSRSKDGRISTGQDSGDGRCEFSPSSESPSTQP